MRRTSGGRSRPKHIPRKQGSAASPALCFCRRTAPKPPTPRRAFPPLGRSPDAHPTPTRRPPDADADAAPPLARPLVNAANSHPPASLARRSPAPPGSRACSPLAVRLPARAPSDPADTAAARATRATRQTLRSSVSSSTHPPRAPQLPAAAPPTPPPIGRKGVGSSPDIPTFLDFRRIMLSLWPENERAEREPGFSDRATDAGGPKR